MEILSSARTLTIIFFAQFYLILYHTRWIYFFSAPIGQGYGLTETCAGATFSEVDDTSVGRVGSPNPCSFIKV